MRSVLRLRVPLVRSRQRMPMRRHFFEADRSPGNLYTHKSIDCNRGLHSCIHFRGSELSHNDDFNASPLLCSEVDSQPPLRELHGAIH